ncbi:MAG: acyl-CoA dehydrogenase, partial [Pseudomonadales bacterium]|nr:acyl-CoA dehydrogenase [Pseudomonadales bacterium]
MGWIKRQVTARLFDAVRGALPHLSDTERQALESGDVWWDAEILSGKPDWERLEAVAGVQFTEAEQAFLDGPVERLCEMIDDWAITFEYRRLPEEIWDFIRQERFL